MARKGKRTKRIGRAAVVLVGGLALGIGSALVALKAYERWLTVRNGPWHAFLAAGSARADLYTRAAVAIGGLLALNKSETLYFIAGEDEQGRALSAACDYRIEGGDLPARWWSLTLYGGDRFLIANPAQRFSYSGSALARDANGGYVLHVSATEQPGNWLPSGQENQLFLALRLYNPAPGAYDDAAHLPLPRIITERCR